MSVDDWWQRDGEWVEPPNRRRDGESGVKRVQDPQLGLLYVKLQTNHLYRSLRYPLGRPTALRERDALQAVSTLGITVPEVVYAADDQQKGHWRAVLVTKSLDGYRDLFHWGLRRERGRVSDERHAEMLRAVGQMLGTLHSQRWQHTNLYPNHIFVTGDAGDEPVRAALIDLENSRRGFSATVAAKRDFGQLRKRASMFTPKDWVVLMQAHELSCHRRSHP